ncbi:hypothetical protein BBO99_00002028 [Phytophthora kernoviae]|uniref:MSP domain-containing protein n=2 Tax=Phytophthora kernoviae TaxID=325452 RepID=A0A3R7FZ05_9STRA|nr:hypothetical protein G195_000841 [Phytophthora kernoviae 00238/432]KAG2532775.1 hypothetical protein JM16_000033 [Phytophthora kernoviae]KAG2533626.1 hypothetical protein JM18_000035 [Phytophthora kernoviae]RLN11095.1 hypothetical protein BBI17_000185 [Phytophthora kernoviae]RLN86137.1 hypothetical protein BBO99_00002028 [Phytophthora kernoviae]
MATGGVDVALAPNSSVILEPADSLSFHLQPQTAPQAVLTIRNVADDRQIAFKVKTTRPLRYLVRPNQGLLGPNGSASIMVILQQKDCDELLRLDPAERQLANDKFLVQSIYVDDSFYELVKTKSTKEMADELTNMMEKMDALRRHHKGGQLVAFTVQLTAQRDVLMSDLDKTRQLLQKASTDAQRVKKLSEESSTLRHRKNGGTTAAGIEDSQAITGKGPKDQGAFGPMHLLICAIIFFLVGRYY